MLLIWSSVDEAIQYGLLDPRSTDTDKRATDSRMIPFFSQQNSVELLFIRNSKKTSCELWQHGLLQNNQWFCSLFIKTNSSANIARKHPL